MQRLSSLFYWQLSVNKDFAEGRGGKMSKMFLDIFDAAAGDDVINIF